VLAVTAYAGKGDEERIREAGAEGYLAKPVSIGPFMQAVMKLVCDSKARNPHLGSGRFLLDRAGDKPLFRRNVLAGRKPCPTEIEIRWTAPPLPTRSPS
jgi:DNA-binding response OmpR family regulator